MVQGQEPKVKSHTSISRRSKAKSHMATVDSSLSTLPLLPYRSASAMASSVARWVPFQDSVGSNVSASE